MALLDQILSGLSSLSGMGGLGQPSNNPSINGSANGNGSASAGIPGLGSMLSGGGTGKILSALMALIASGRLGGFEGLLNKFNNSGMQNQLASWVSTRPNEAVSAAQVEQVLGEDAVQEVATKAGVDKTEAAQGLAEIIPQFVDKMTPTGVMPQQDIISSVMGKLTSRF